MCKSKIFAEILKIVSVETEIPEEKILSTSKESDIVDARSILVNVLFENGYYPNQISEYINKTPASVRYLISRFSQREITRKMFANNLQNIRKRLANN